MDSVQENPGRVLLKTRAGAAVGAVVTAYVLVLTIRALLQPADAESGWLITSDRWIPNWVAILVSVAMYAGLCWGGLFVYPRRSWTRAAFSGHLVCGDLAITAEGNRPPVGFDNPLRLCGWIRSCAVRCSVTCVANRQTHF